MVVSGSRHTRKHTNFIPRCHPYARKSASKEALSKMQLTLHATRPMPHGASRLVLAMSAWSVKTQHAPCRHCRDARVCGHATTAMHEMSAPPHPTRLEVATPETNQLVRRCHPCTRKSASHAVLSRMQLTSCDSPNTSRCFPLGARDVCLVGENPTCCVPAL